MIREKKILIIGACGQIGTELTAALRMLHGDEQVIAADRYAGHPDNYVQLDVLDIPELKKYLKKIRLPKFTCWRPCSQ